MGYILLFFILINFSIFLSTIFKKKIEECILLSVGYIILSIFIIGVITSLTIGFWFVIITSISALIYNILSIVNKKIDKKLIFTSGFFCFTLIYLIIIWANDGRVVSLWDEFSHWALTVKNMFIHDKFSYIASSTDLFKDYPPATSIFQYFALKMFGNYHESVLYVAMYTMFFSTIIMLFKYIQKFNIINSILILFLLILLPTILFPYVYITLQVDAMLGVLLGGLLFSYFLDEKKDLFTLIKLLMFSFLLVLTKQIGLVFAILGMFIVGIDYFFVYNKFTFNEIYKNKRLIAMSILSIVIPYFLWKYAVNMNTENLSWTGKMGLKEVFDVIFFNAPDYRYSVIKRYIVAIISTPIESLSFSMPYIGWMSFFIINYLVISKQFITNKIKIIKTAALSIGLSVLIYTLILLMLYMFKFSEWEALNLASYSRYMASYLLAVLLFIAAMWLKVLITEKKDFSKKIILIFCAVVIFVNINPLIEMTILKKQSIKVTTERRQDYIIFEKTIDKYLKQNDRLYFISQNDTGGPYYIALYLATPIKINPPTWSWSIGKKYYEGDLWTQEIDLIKLKTELLNNYDYVYIFNSDDQFFSQYKQLFDQNKLERNQLYFVDKKAENDKILKLVN